MKNNKPTQSNKWSKQLLFLIIFLFLIILTNIITYKIVQSNISKIKNIDFSLINPARQFINQDDMIVNIQPLREQLQSLGENNPNISIYFEFLNTGSNIAVNKDAEFFPASLSKLPLALSAVKKIERGEWEWGNELVIMPMDKDDRFGELYKKPIGTKITIEELIREMLVNSDNTAYSMILRNLEPDEFKNTQKHLGMDSFFSEDGKISAKNYVVILRALYSSTYLSLDNSEKVINMMINSNTNIFLSAGLPSGVKFSHKIGISKEKNVYLDAGIVYVPDRPYFLIVMINGIDEKKVAESMKNISEVVYNYVENYDDENN